tara:strand:- start:271 stop:1074 length:804 start_codon:yes stop_codon:yes gene_type:complete
MLPNELVRLKKQGRPITILTAWDAVSASIVESSGADVVLVGDSLGMVILGHCSTLPVTIDQIIHHTQAVGRGFSKPLNQQPLVVCDMPFLSYQCGEDKAVEAAGSLIKNSCAKAVKIEGGEPEIIKIISRLIRMGIPVMGHLGLTPQSVNCIGYKRQAEEKRSQEKLFFQALELEKAGCFAIVLEHVPDQVAIQLQKKSLIPIIGIGAGKNCDGQIRVTADLLGLNDKQPPFAKPLISIKKLCIQALKEWVIEQQSQVEIPTKSSSQ